MPVLTAVLLPLLAAPLALVAARWKGAVWVLALATSLGTLVATAIAAVRESTFDVAWVPSWNARFVLHADGLASLMALLTVSIGILVLVYSRDYIPHHLEEHDRPREEAGRFVAFMLLFMGSMVGLAFARDLLPIYVFFELTAVCSYFLIAYDREDDEARRAALCALLVTGISAVALLIGALLWQIAAGATALDGFLAVGVPAATREWAAALVIIAALAKSAQVPFHFWLPRAMAAPTPVSAYLHSAAMVAAGVFLLLRLEPLLADTIAYGLLPYIGLASILVGSVLALGADVLKQLLAGSTIAQYGYIVLLIGLGGDAGIAGATLYLLAHAIAKSGLFLVAGAVTRATGEDRLSRLGGLASRLPFLAVATALLGAALAGLPLTIGYFKDEALFNTGLEHGPAFAGAAAVAVALTLAYTARFWFGIFAASRSAEHNPAAGVPWWLGAPVGVLAALALAGGVLPTPLSEVASAAGTAAHAAAVELHVAYQIAPPLWLALGAWVAGVLVYASRSAWLPLAAAARRVGDRVGPEAAYDAALGLLNRVSTRLHELEVRDLRDRIAAIMIPAGVLVVLAMFVARASVGWEAGTVTPASSPLMVALAVLAATAVLVPGRRTHLQLVIAMTAAGLVLASIYALIGAPDLALVAVLVETTLTLLLLAAFGVLPAEAIRREEVRTGELRVQRRKHRIAGIATGLAAFVGAWAALSSPEAGGVADVHREWSHRVRAEDPVSAILSDFRGLDTAGETTVIALSLLGLVTLLRRGRAG